MVPLTAFGVALGAVCLGFAAPHTFSPAEREHLVLIGQRCGEALERARLYEAERGSRVEAQRSAESLAELQSVTATLTGASTAADVGEAVLDAAIPALEAAAGLVIVQRADNAELAAARNLPGAPQQLGPRPVTAHHRGARDRAVVRRRASGRPPARRGDGARAARRGRREGPRAGPAAGARPRGRRARRGLERRRSALAQDVVDAGDVRRGLRSGTGACRALRCRARHRRHVAAQPAPGAPGPPRAPRAARSVSRRHPRDPGGWRLVRRHPAARRSGLPGRRRCRGSRRPRRGHDGPAARRAASTDAHHVRTGRAALGPQRGPAVDRQPHGDHGAGHRGSRRSCGLRLRRAPTPLRSIPRWRR